MEKYPNLIVRQNYLDKISPYIGKNLIKILTGQRRVGKSFILESVAREITRRDNSANIIQIDLEDFAFSHIHDAASLHDEIKRRFKDNCQNYIFIDEIQEVQEFDKVIRSLNLDPNNDIYITGSNSKMLSSEIGSRLAGRHIEIKVHPLSYLEFLQFHALTDSNDAMMQYLRYGGLPYLHNLPLSNTWGEYLSGVTDAIVYRDIVTRHDIRNNDFLQRLMMFLSNNIGQIVSAKKISDFLKSQRISVSVSSVQSYIGYLAEACIINSVQRWDIEGKRYFEIGEKYYFEDLGIRNCITGFRPNDVGSVMENAVYNHLIATGHEVKVGTMTAGKEIDFIAQKNGETTYLQVALQVSGQETFDREFGNLLQINDNYAKKVITLHDSAPNTYQGIEMLSLREFLKF